MEKTLILLAMIISLTACGGGVDNTASNTITDTNIVTDTTSDTDIDANSGSNSDNNDSQDLELKDLEVANRLGFLTEEEYNVTKEIILKKYGS